MYGTVWYGTVQYSRIQYKTVQYDTVQYSTVHCSTEQYDTVPCVTYNIYVSLGFPCVTCNGCNGRFNLQMD